MFTFGISHQSVSLRSNKHVTKQSKANFFWLFFIHWLCQQTTTLPSMLPPPTGNQCNHVKLALPTIQTKQGPTHKNTALSHYEWSKTPQGPFNSCLVVPLDTQLWFCDIRYRVPHSIMNFCVCVCVQTFFIPPPTTASQSLCVNLSTSH